MLLVLTGKMILTLILFSILAVIFWGIINVRERRRCPISRRAAASHPDAAPNDARGDGQAPQVQPWQLFVHGDRREGHPGEGAPGARGEPNFHSPTGQMEKVMLKVRVEVKDRETEEVYDILEFDVPDTGLDINAVHLIKGTVANRLKDLQVAHE